jgi:hypothetical protein
MRWPREARKQPGGFGAARGRNAAHPGQASAESAEKNAGARENRGAVLLKGRRQIRQVRKVRTFSAARINRRVQRSEDAFQ